MFQELTIVGNLGGDPEMKYTPSGQAVTNLSVAANRKWTDGSGQLQEETIWFRVAVWGKMAEACNQYLSKGRQVFVKGRLRPDENGGPRIWQDQNGNPRASFEVTATEVKFLGGRGDSNGGGYNSQQESMTEDEIPF